MRKIKRIIIIIILLLCTVYLKSYATNTEYSYELDSNNNATITAYKGTNTEITIPNTIDGYQVKSISSHAFDESRNSNTKGKNLVKVTVSDGITSIGDFAFVGCTNLETIKLPEGLTELGDQTFIGCSKLKEINIPSTLKRLKTYVFQETAFTEFTIPENVEYIGACDFRLCQNLKKFIVYADNLQYANNVFEYCSNDLILYGKTGSTTENYAKINGLNFADISTLTSDANNENTYHGYDVLGTIKIPKTNVSYPVLKKLTRKSLETSVVAIYPQDVVLNSKYNVVIIGHNYQNGTFFSRNKELSNGDEIYITGLNNDKVTYYIYKIYETSEDDISMYNRDTNGKREITLSTATDDGTKRLIILASETKYIQQDDGSSNLSNDKNDSNQEEQQKKDNDNNEEETESKKQEDSTVSNKKLPYTGSRYIILGIIITLVIGIYLYNKNKNTFI